MLAVTITGKKSEEDFNPQKQFIGRIRVTSGFIYTPNLEFSIPVPGRERGRFRESSKRRASRRASGLVVTTTYPYVVLDLRIVNTLKVIIKET